MAEHGNPDQHTGSAGDTDQASDAPRSRRPSAVLLVTGVLALLVSGWALAGPFSLEPLGDGAFRWIVVGVAVVVGLVLVFTPGRRSR
ncbi:hypothetical protein [Rhodococcus sp. HNM0569]|uniref:hypothetical protein n=1 Tax=Rhodococcus sp. HNM0569 TaxID=2716340 RepID=UPI003211DEBF